jgi:hypothetical protein
VLSHLRTQTGSVTAELAVVLPSVLLVGSTLIGGLLLGAQKVQVTYAAGTLARAVARGESISKLATALGVEVKSSFLADFACVTASKTNQPIAIESESCARKLGL